MALGQPNRPCGGLLDGCAAARRRREIQQATDMTLEMLNQVDWVQVLTDAAIAIGVILVAVGVGVLVVTLGIPEAIIGAFY